jgi:uncharacterized membrane protein YdbT with pleckstrin-like domain
VDCTPGEEVYFHGHPSWLSMLPFIARWLAASLVLGVAAGIGSVIAGGRVQTSWVIAAVLAVCLLMYCRGQLRRMRVTYRITSRRLTIETGLLSRRVHQARLEHIQDVDTRQTLLQRALGIGTVVFDTAGDVPYAFSFRGVDEPHRIVATVDRALQQTDEGWRLGIFDFAR